MTLYFRLGDSLPTCAKNMTDPWLEWVNASVFVNESTDSTSLTGTVCASTGLVFVAVIILLGPTWLALLGKLKLSYIRSPSKPLDLGWLLQWGFSLNGLRLGEYGNEMHSKQ